MRRSKTSAHIDLICSDDPVQGIIQNETCSRKHLQCDVSCENVCRNSANGSIHSLTLAQRAQLLVLVE